MSKDKKEIRYIQIPLCWLQMVWKDPKKALEQALSYGIIYRARKIPYSLDEAAKQIIYDYHRGDLTKEARSVYIDLEDANREGEDFFPPEDMLFDEKGNFDPTGFENVVEACKKYPDFEKLAIQNYQIHVSAHFLNVTTNSKADTLKRAAVVQAFQDKQEQRYLKQPMPMVNVDLAFRFRDNPENIELLTSYIAIKSLIGQHKFTGTHRLEVVRRMIGAKSNEALQKALKDPILQAVYQKYSNRYWFDRLVYRLLDEGFLQSKIGYGRRGHNQGIYFSTVYDMQQLTEAIDQATRLKCHKSQEKKAVEELKRRLSHSNVTDNLNVTE